MNEQVFTYDFDALAQARDDVAATVRDYQQTHDEVNALLQGLSKTWSSGKAAEALQGWRGEWSSIFADFVDELDQLRVALDRSHANATGAEDANLRMWTG